jgi:hypothetical protein
MRKLLLLPFFLLLALALATGPAQASSPSATTSLSPAGEEAEELEDETGEDEAEEPEEAAGECTIEDEEDAQLCAEIAQEEGEAAEAERCVIEDATAEVAANPGNDTVRLTIHYRTFAPIAVAIDSKLRGAKGGLHLGASHSRFRRAGVFRDSFGLSKKEMAKALAAREFAIDLHAVNTPGYCRMQLTAHRGGTRRLLWS